MSRSQPPPFVVMSTEPYGDDAQSFSRKGHRGGIEGLKSLKAIPS